MNARFTNVVARFLASLALVAVSCGDGNLQTTDPHRTYDVGVDDTSTGPASDSPSMPDVTPTPTPSDAGGEDVDATDVEDVAPEPEVCARVKVTVEANEVLNIRPTPGTSGAPVGTLIRGYVVKTTELVRGDAVDGEDRWYGIESPRGNGYVHFDFVECTEEEITTMPIGWYMPFACNAQHRVTQGPGGGTSHTGNASNAYDFACGLNTSIRAMMGGTVSYINMDTKPGDPCYNGGGSSCSNASNTIMIAHPNGQSSLYKHLNSASVAVGQEVTVGQEIGLSGNTGWSTGPHLHIGVCDGATTNPFCQTRDFSFQDIGRPANVTQTSGNCP